MPRKLLCQMGPVGYWLSLRKEYLLRDAKNLFGGRKFARTRRAEPLPCLVKGHTSLLLRRLYGVDMALQYGKITNLRLAASRLNGIVVQPDETFSFWGLVGRPTRRRGYTDVSPVHLRQHRYAQRGARDAGESGKLCTVALRRPDRPGLRRRRCVQSGTVLV